MKKVRLGIVGVGVQGKTYANFLVDPEANGPESMVLGALCDIDPDVEAFCKETYPDTPFYNDYKDLIASGDVDAIVTTVPHYLHPEMAIYSIGQKMPVLVEKPAGVYNKQVREMNDFAAANPDVPFAIMFNQRTNSLYRKLKAIMDSGELGEMRRTNWIINSWWRPDSYYKQSAWRATWGGEGGGVVVNQAPHQLDLWQWICGIPTSVYAEVGFGAHRDIVVDNDVTAVTTYENGATGVFITSTHDPVGTDRLEIDCEKGKIVVDDSKTATVYRFSKGEDELNETMSMMDLFRLVSSNVAGAKLYEEEVIESTDVWGRQHINVLENFGRHILDGTELLAPGSDGINGVNLANGILLSAWKGEKVALPVDEDEFLAELNKHIEAEGKYPTR